jgi:hypothetical protein
METRAHTHTCPPRRVLALLALLLALLVVAAGLAAGAAARPQHAGHASCTTSHHAKHAAAKRCAKHHSRKHKTRKASKTAAPAPKLTPAKCEDGTAPVRATSGAYTCEDGSEPACQDGTDPVHLSASPAPVCRVSQGGAGHECGQGQSGECGPEFTCEEEVTEGPQGCEHGSAFEEEELEA